MDGIGSDEREGGRDRTSREEGKERTEEREERENEWEVTCRAVP